MPFDQTKIGRLAADLMDNLERQWVRRHRD